MDLCKVSVVTGIGDLIKDVRALSEKTDFKMVSVKNEIGDNSETFPSYLSGFKKTSLYVRGYVTQLDSDSYGDSLFLIPADAVLRALKISNERYYRRFPPAIAVLESIINEFDEEIYCVLYGY
jgi:hypothetical protein